MSDDETARKNQQLFKDYTPEMESIRKEVFKEVGYSIDAYIQLRQILNKQIKKTKQAADKDPASPKQADGGNTKDLIKGFAKKGYQELYKSNKKEALENAKDFLNLLFGSVQQLLKQGPDHAMQNEIFTQATLGTYSIRKNLGKGGQAEVKLGIDLNTQEKVAVKIFKSAKYGDDNFINEVSLLKSINHTNIVQLKTFFHQKSYREGKVNAAVLELCGGGEVVEYLSYVEHFNEPLGRWFLRQLVEAVDYCHRAGIVHRDLKHDNCLFNRNYVLKVTDFGFARKWDFNKGNLMKEFVGTAEYAAPEIIDNKPYNEQVDVFSMGVMMFVLLTRSKPFKRASSLDPKYSHFMAKDAAQFWRIHLIKNKVVTLLSVEARQLITGMMWTDPKERFSVKRIKEHEWMQGKTYTHHHAAKHIHHKRADRYIRTVAKAGKSSDDQMTRDIQEPIQATHPEAKPGGQAKFIPVTVLGRKETMDPGTNKINAIYKIRYEKGKQNLANGRKKKLKGQIVELPSSELYFPSDLAPLAPFDQPHDCVTYFYSDHRPSDVIQTLAEFFKGESANWETQWGSKFEIPEYDEDYQGYDEKNDDWGTNVVIEKDENGNNLYTMHFSVLLLPEALEEPAAKDSKAKGKKAASAAEPEVDEEKVDEDPVPCEGFVRVLTRRQNPAQCQVEFNRCQWREETVYGDGKTLPKTMIEKSGKVDPLLFNTFFIEVVLKAMNVIVCLPDDCKEYQNYIPEKMKDQIRKPVTNLEAGKILKVEETADGGVVVTGSRDAATAEKFQSALGSGDDGKTDDVPSDVDPADLLSE